MKTESFWRETSGPTGLGSHESIYKFTASEVRECAQRTFPKTPPSTGLPRRNESFTLTVLFVFNVEFSINENEHTSWEIHKNREGRFPGSDQEVFEVLFFKLT